MSKLNSNTIRLVKEVVCICSREYGLEENVVIERVLSSLGSSSLESGSSSLSSSLEKVYPMPYSGEYEESKCKGLRKNNGLYTQCSMSIKVDEYCKKCKISADKNGGIPEYGTISQRRSTDINSYVDPKGRKPISFIKVMNKLKISEEEVKKEAVRLGITIDECHFVVGDTKRGRPAQEKKEKDKKGVKGRPKKEKKVLEIGGEEDDLFASLVASAFNPHPPLGKVEPNILANVEPNQVHSVEDVAPIVVTEVATFVVTELVDSVENVTPFMVTELVDSVEVVAPDVATEVVETVVTNSGDLAENSAAVVVTIFDTLVEKSASEVVVKKTSKKAESEAKKAAKEAIKLEKEAQKLEKEAQKLEKEAQKLEKEAQKAAKETKKVEKETKKKPAAAAALESEEEIVKKIEVDGKKYLKSKSTGIIYDYTEYIKNGEQVVLGKWNESANKIDFQESGEESEDEYE